MAAMLRKLAVSIGIVAFVAFSPLVHANIETNGGFETGDFTGWTQFGTTAYDYVDTGMSHSGDFSAFFGAPASMGGISQTLTTIVGQIYAVDFWLSNLDGTPNAFSWSWNGVTQTPGFVDFSASDYTNYNVLVTATSTSTELSFSFQNDTSFWLLDDVSVTDTGRNSNTGNNPNQVPEPGTLLLLGIALGATGLLRRKH